jgi:hypothetical protein
MSPPPLPDPTPSRDASSPYIVLTRPVCTNCGAIMRLAQIELHPIYLQCEVCRYDCRCGAIQSNTVDHRSTAPHTMFPGENKSPR